MNNRVLLLVGSPRGLNSTSNALGGYLLEKFSGKGYETEKIYIRSSINSEKGPGELLNAVRSADLIILASPLYADSLHTGVIKAMELITEDRGKRPPEKKQRLLFISNCGFPEASQNSVAVSICKRFSKEAGFEWAGGLMLGGGESIGGRELNKIGGLARNVRRSLEMAADSLQRGEPLPEEAVLLMERPLVPHWLYAWIGNRGWRKRAKKEGCKTSLKNRPYSHP